MPLLWLDITRPDGARHLYPLGEHDRPDEAADAIAVARAEQGVPDDDVRDVDAWPLIVHQLHGDEELPEQLLAACTVHDEEV